ncbi:MAG: Crp/Fnr family transcriptional regulator [Saccharofermentanales bacterium]|jgi:CRP-like cAMP-binding protein
MDLPLLDCVPLFQGIDRCDLGHLLTCLNGVVRRHAKQSILLIPGETTERFGVVLEGRVELSDVDYTGHRHILDTLGRGALFGEVFALTGRPATVGVTAVEPTTVLHLDGRKLAEPCHRRCPFHRRLNDRMLIFLAEKNYHLTRKVNIHAKRTTRHKVLAYLTDVARAAHSDHITIPLNRQQMADYLAVDRSALSAELSRMRDEGLITFHRNQFTLHVTPRDAP